VSWLTAKEWVKPKEGPPWVKKGVGGVRRKSPKKQNRKKKAEFTHEDAKRGSGSKRIWKVGRGAKAGGGKGWGPRKEHGGGSLR